MIRFASNASIVAALTYFALAVSAALCPPDAMPANYSPPANWKYAAAREGHTFHAKGCGLMPTLPANQMVYGNSVREMLGSDKEPCAYCVRDLSASVSREPQTSPSKNITHGNH